MAHPDVDFVGQAVKELRFTRHSATGRAVLACRGTIDASPQCLASQLHAIADAEYRQPQFENFGIAFRRATFVDARRATRENQTFGLVSRDLFGSDIVPHNLAENMLLPNTPRDQLCVLRAKIENQHALPRCLR